MTTTLAPPRTTAAVDECMNILESHTINEKEHAMTILLNRPQTAAAPTLPSKPVQLPNEPTTSRPPRRLARLFHRNPQPPALPEKTSRSFRELVDQLNALNTAADVADLMRREGVTGVRGKSNRCVIAEWLCTNLDDRHPGTLRVGFHGAVQLGTRPSRVNAGDWSRPVTSFIIAFDRGAYPELIRR